MANRIRRLRSRMQELELSTFLISSITNLRYLFGFTGSNGLGALTSDRCFFITDKRYKDQVRREVKNAEIFIVFQDLLAPLKEKKLVNAHTRLGFEAAHLSFRDFSRLRENFKKAQLVATENIVERITIEKLPDEREKTRKACQIALQVWKQILPAFRPGVAELDIAAEISFWSKKLGAEGDAFEPIVASGWRSALPHGTATRKKLEPGDLVITDFGCSYEGYKSDITRTIMIGEPSAEQKRMYDAVKGASQIAIDAIKPGMAAIDLDKIARNYLQNHGFAGEFSHSLGHGLGLDVHSLPRIGPKSKDTLLPHSIITIEPGVYVPEIGGVRIEDDVYLHPECPEVLTQISRELIVIE